MRSKSVDPILELDQRDQDLDNDLSSFIKEPVDLYDPDHKDHAVKHA